MMRPIRVMLIFALALPACAGAESSRSDRVIVVPSTATTAPSYRGDGSVPSRRYVVRMSDGKRDWEVEFPEVATGYELRIPLGQGGAGGDDGVIVGAEQLTEADKQLLEALRRRNLDHGREGIYEDGKNKADPPGRNQLGAPEPGAELPPAPGEADGATPKSGAEAGVDPWAGTEDQPAPTRRSYFLGLEQVKKLYRAGKLELAIVYLKKLEQDYPNDVQIMAMMGTLWLKTGQEDLAREYWERVLQVDPANRAVIEALKQLNSRQGASPAAPAAPNAAPQGDGALAPI